MKATGWINFISLIIIVYTVFMMLSEDLKTAVTGLCVCLLVIFANCVLMFFIDKNPYRTRERYLRIKKMFENL